MQQHPYGDAESLFRASQHDVFRVAYSLMRNKADAEDIAQESFCKLLTAWARRVAALSTAADQRAYLIRIVTNEARQVLRDPYRKRELPGAYAGEPDAAGESADGKVQATDEVRAIWEAISKLPPSRRDVISLYAAGYEYEEIAARLGIAISTVRSHISHARGQLGEARPRERKGAR
jgi:RNA polymerase sigma-70 factor, ECF subfamily